MVNREREWRIMALIAVLFLACFCLPNGTARFDHAVLLESLHLLRGYAREHVLLCLAIRKTDHAALVRRGPCAGLLLG